MTDNDEDIDATFVHYYAAIQVCFMQKTKEFPNLIASILLKTC